MLTPKFFPVLSAELDQEIFVAHEGEETLRSIAKRLGIDADVAKLAYRSERARQKHLKILVFENGLLEAYGRGEPLGHISTRLGIPLWTVERGCQLAIDREKRTINPEVCKAIYIAHNNEETFACIAERLQINPKTVEGLYLLERRRYLRSIMSPERDREVHEARERGQTFVAIAQQLGVNSHNANLAYVRESRRRRDKASRDACTVWGDIRVAVSGLSVRAQNHLVNEGMWTMREVADHVRDHGMSKLRLLPNFGDKSANEILAWLDHHKS